MGYSGTAGTATNWSDAGQKAGVGTTKPLASLTKGGFMSLHQIGESYPGSMSPAFKPHTNFLHDLALVYRCRFATTPDASMYQSSWHATGKPGTRYIARLVQPHVHQVHSFSSSMIPLLRGKGRRQQTSRLICCRRMGFQLLRHHQKRSFPFIAPANST